MSFPLPINPENVGIMLATGILGESGLASLKTADRIGFQRGRMPADLQSQAASDTNLTNVAARTGAKVLATAGRRVFMNLAQNNVYTSQATWGEQLNTNSITIRAARSYVPASANSGNSWAGVVTVVDTFFAPVVAKEVGGLPVVSSLAEMVAAGGALSGDGRSITIPPGFIVESDDQPWSAFGHTTTTAANKAFWHRTETTVPAIGQTWPSCGILLSSATNEISACFAPGVAASQVYSSVPVDFAAATSTSVSGNIESAVVGAPVPGNAIAAVLGNGMSITLGRNATTDSGANSTSGGYMSGAMKQVGLPHTIVALGSSETKYYVGRRAGLLWLSRYVDEAFLDMSTNSIAAGDSVATIQSRFSSISLEMKRIGVAKVHWLTCTPRAASTNNFVDLAGQTTRDAHFGSGEERDQWNTAIQTLSAGQDSWIDTTSYVEDPTDRTAWLTNGVAGTYITTASPGSHIHPTNSGHVLMKGTTGEPNSLVKRLTDALPH